MDGATVTMPDSTPLQNVRRRAKKQIDGLHEARAFISSIRHVKHLLAKGGPEELDIDVSTGSGLTFVEITVTAIYEDREDVIDVSTERDWDQYTLGTYEGGWRVWAKERFYTNR